jgi:cation diffusion facilitator family transporter
LNPQHIQAERSARRIAIISVLSSAGLALMKILVGTLARSAAVVADGFESAGDVGSSALVLLGLVVASKPPDKEHPYGHGRFEMLTGLAVGAMLGLAGMAICIHSLWEIHTPHRLPALFGVWPLVISIGDKFAL